MAKRFGWLLAAAPLLGGCQAALAVGAIHASTFGEPTMVDEYAGDMLAFGSCLNAGFPGTVMTNLGGDQQRPVIVKKPDVGSYEFYVRVERRGGDKVSVTTWVAGWASGTKTKLEQRYKVCSEQ